MSPKLGVLSPDSDQVAQADCQEAGRSRPAFRGLCCKCLGLSTQVPGRKQDATTSASSKVRVGNQTLTFKQVAPKRIAARASVASSVIQALDFVGKDGVTDSVVNGLRSKLSAADKRRLLKESRYAAGWGRRRGQESGSRLTGGHAMDGIARTTAAERSELFSEAAAQRGDITAEVIEKDFWGLLDPEARLRPGTGPREAHLQGRDLALQSLRRHRTVLGRHRPLAQPEDLGSTGERDPYQAASGKKQAKLIDELVSRCKAAIATSFSRSSGSGSRPCSESKAQAIPPGA